MFVFKVFLNILFPFSNANPPILLHKPLLSSIAILLISNEIRLFVLFRNEAQIVQIGSFSIRVLQLNDVFSGRQRNDKWLAIIASDREQRPFVGRFAEAAAAREGEDADVAAIDCQTAPCAIGIAVTSCKHVVSVNRNRHVP